MATPRYLRAGVAKSVRSIPSQLIIAKIDARGLKEIYKKLLECSGQDDQKRLSKAAQKRLEILRTQGDDDAKNGQFGKAIESYTKALAIDPSDATIYRWRATAYYDFGNYEKAVEDYTKALTIKPDYQSALSWRAMAYRHLKQSDAAVTDFTKAIALEPNDAFNYTWRGMTYSDLKGGMSRLLTSQEPLLWSQTMGSTIDGVVVHTGTSVTTRKPSLISRGELNSNPTHLPIPSAVKFTTR